MQVPVRGLREWYDEVNKVHICFSKSRIWLRFVGRDFLAAFCECESSEISI